MQQMRAEGLMATAAGGAAGSGAAGGSPAPVGSGGPPPKEGAGTKRIRREVFLKAADGSWQVRAAWRACGVPLQIGKDRQAGLDACHAPHATPCALQKSHEVMYIGRDRPGQLHSLYQARPAVSPLDAMLRCSGSSLQQICAPRMLCRKKVLAAFHMGLARGQWQVCCRGWATQGRALSSELHGCVDTPTVLNHARHALHCARSPQGSAAQLQCRKGPWTGPRWRQPTGCWPWPRGRQGSGHQGPGFR